MMLKLLSLILFFVPHPFNVFLRRMFGQKIGVGSKISIFSFIMASKVDIGVKAYVAPFTIIKCFEIKLSDFSHISPFSIVLAPVISGACFHLGRHSRVFPFCWIEPGEGVFIGEHVGIGGHTLIFTHGSWSDFLHSGPVSFGPVKIDDHVWLPWRVFVMPNVTIGKRSIIGANSTVTTSVPEFCLAAGAPAKIIKDGINGELNRDQFMERVKILLAEYVKFSRRMDKPISLEELKRDVSFYRSNKREQASPESFLKIDMSNYTFTQPPSFNSEGFIQFLRRYGIRLEEERTS